MDDQQAVALDYRIGDVLLVRGRTTLSKFIANSQKLIYAKAQSSHVLLGLGDGMFLHATLDGGVDLIFLLDELANIQEDWRVLRLAEISDQQRTALQMAGLHFLRQGYNKKFFGPEQDDSSFCSELVAKAFRKADIHIFGGKRVGMVTPASFDRAADSGADWLDVSDVYKRHLPRFTADQGLYRFGFNLVKQTLARRHVHSGLRNTMMNMLVQLSADDEREAKQAFIDEQRQYVKENRALSFWDED